MIFVGVMRKTCRSQVGVLHTCRVVAHACVLATGAPLWTILRAGEWRSPAFLTYLDLHLCACAPLRVFLALVSRGPRGRLEKDVVIQAHVDESDESNSDSD